MRFGNFGSLTGYKPLCPYPCPDREPGCRERCPIGIEDDMRHKEYSAAIKALTKTDVMMHGYYSRLKRTLTKRDHQHKQY